MGFISFSPIKFLILKWFIIDINCSECQTNSVETDPSPNYYGKRLANGFDTGFKSRNKTKQNKNLPNSSQYHSKVRTRKKNKEKTEENIFKGILTREFWHL